MTKFTLNVKVLHSTDATFKIYSRSTVPVEQTMLQHLLPRKMIGGKSTSAANALQQSF